MQQKELQGKYFINPQQIKKVESLDTGERFFVSKYSKLEVKHNGTEVIYERLNINQVQIVSIPEYVGKVKNGFKGDISISTDNNEKFFLSDNSEIEPMDGSQVYFNIQYSKTNQKFALVIKIIDHKPQTIFGVMNQNPDRDFRLLLRSQEKQEEQNDQEIEVEIENENEKNKEDLFISKEYIKKNLLGIRDKDCSVILSKEQKHSKVKMFLQNKDQVSLDRQCVYVKGKLILNKKFMEYEVQLTENLGYLGKEEDDVQFIYESYGLIGLKFSSEILKEVKKVEQDYKKELSKYSQQVKEIFSLDQEGTKIKDQGFSINQVEGQDWWEIGVHITNVSDFLSDLLYREAEKRQQKVQIKKGMTRNMIPYQLEKLLSLDEGKVKETVSFYIYVNKKGLIDLQRCRIEKEKVKNAKALSFKEGDKILEEQKEQKIQKYLRDLKEIVESIEKQREEEGFQREEMEKFWNENEKIVEYECDRVQNCLMTLLNEVFYWKMKGFDCEKKIKGCEKTSNQLETNINKLNQEYNKILKQKQEEEKIRRQKEKENFQQVVEEIVKKNFSKTKELLIELKEFLDIEEQIEQEWFQNESEEFWEKVSNDLNQKLKINVQILLEAQQEQDDEQNLNKQESLEQQEEVQKQIETEIQKEKKQIQTVIQKEKKQIETEIQKEKKQIETEIQKEKIDEEQMTLELQKVQEELEKKQKEIEEEAKKIKEYEDEQERKRKEKEEKQQEKEKMKNEQNSESDETESDSDSSESSKDSIKINLIKLGLQDAQRTIDFLQNNFFKSLIKDGLDFNRKKAYSLKLNEMISNQKEKKNTQEILELIDVVMRMNSKQIKLILDYNEEQARKQQINQVGDKQNKNQETYKNRKNFKQEEGKQTFVKKSNNQNKQQTEIKVENKEQKEEIIQSQQKNSGDNQINQKDRQQIQQKKNQKEEQFVQIQLNEKEVVSTVQEIPLKQNQSQSKDNKINEVIQQEKIESEVQTQQQLNQNQVKEEQIQNEDLLKKESQQETNLQNTQMQQNQQNPFEKSNQQLEKKIVTEQITQKEQINVQEENEIDQIQFKMEILDLKEKNDQKEQENIKQERIQINLEIQELIQQDSQKEEQVLKEEILKKEFQKLRQKFNKDQEKENFRITAPIRRFKDIQCQELALKYVEFEQIEQQILEQSEKVETNLEEKIQLFKKGTLKDQLEQNIFSNPLKVLISDLKDIQKEIKSIQKDLPEQITQKQKESQKAEKEIEILNIARQIINQNNPNKTFKAIIFLDRPQQFQFYVFDLKTMIDETIDTRYRQGTRYLQFELVNLNLSVLQGYPFILNAKIVGKIN